MKRTITTGLLTVVFLGLSTAAQEQDWYGITTVTAATGGISGGLACS